MPRFIVIEGCDKTGKTTLAKTLCDQLNGRFFHYSKPTAHPLEYFKPAFDALEADPETPVICDRFIVGEKVYAKVKKEPSQWTDDEYASYLKKMEEAGAMLLFLWDYNDQLKKRCEEEKETYVTPREALKVQTYFLKEAKRIAKAYPRLLVFKVRVFTNYWSLV